MLDYSEQKDPDDTTTHIVLFCTYGRSKNSLIINTSSYDGTHYEITALTRETWNLTSFK